MAGIVKMKIRDQIGQNDRDDGGDMRLHLAAGDQISSVTTGIAAQSSDSVALPSGL